MACFIGGMLPNRDVSDQSLEVLATARCILAAAVDSDGTEFSIIGIAERTGFTTDQVRSIMASPLYLQLIQQEAVQLISHALVRGVRRMDKIVNDTKTTDANRIAAHRATVHTYQAVTQRPTAPKRGEDAGLDEWARQFIDGNPPNPPRLQ